MSNTTSKSRNKVGKPINTGIDILVKLDELGGKATAAELGVSNNPLYYLKRAHGVVEVATVKGEKLTRKHTDADGNVQRGRPANVWKLTGKGRKRVQRRKTQAA
jgi:predicted ArsR family transcriptional regulator